MCVCVYVCMCVCRIFIALTVAGEKLSDEEVETLLAGHEDSQGNINYEDFVRQVMCG